MSTVLESASQLASAAADKLNTMTNGALKPNSGVNVLIVGGGFAGLAAAIESVLEGHKVILLERFKKLAVLGDIISFGTNAGRQFERWGVGAQMYEHCAHLKTFDMWNHKGEQIFSQNVSQEEFGARSYNGHRGELHQILWKKALALGVDIRCGSDVTEFGETATEAWLICNGHKMTADVIIGADGVRSNARKLVLGYNDKPKASGYAIYRTWFKIKDTDMATDPLTSWLIKEHDTFNGWIGEDVHFLVTVLKNAEDCCWVITHKDDADIEESWSFPGKIDDVAAIVKDWDPRCEAIIRKAPSAVDWKLVYRDPLPTWVSKEGRLAIIGDAAHPFLPTSVQGASQAMEDGICLAITLGLAGKEDVPTAVRAFEKIRYQRVRRAQVTGETNRNKWHKTSAEDSKKNPESVKLSREEWLLGHDCASHARNVYAEVANDIHENGYNRPTLPAEDETPSQPAPLKI